MVNPRLRGGGLRSLQVLNLAVFFGSNMVMRSIMVDVNGILIVGECLRHVNHASYLVFRDEIGHNYLVCNY